MANEYTPKLEDTPVMIQELQEQVKVLTQVVAESSKPRVNSPWLSMEQAIEYIPYKVGKRTLVNNIKAGRLIGHKAGKSFAFLAKDLDAYLTSGK